LDTVIKGGTLVLGEQCLQADLGIEGEVIAAIGGILEAENEIDASGCLVLPGAIDPHTHLALDLGPGLKTGDDFGSGSRAAAMGGTTTIINYAEQCGYSGLGEALDDWMLKAEGKSCIDYSFHMLINDPSSQVLDEMELLVRQGITSFKVLLAYKDIVMLDDSQLFRVLRRAGELGAIVNVHAENGSLIDELTADLRGAGKIQPVYHARSRPEIAEEEATFRALALAKAADAPVYIVHMTCKGAVEVLKRARLSGQKAFGETCPQYLLLDESVYEADLDSASSYILSPPLRDKANQEVLWNSLSSGLLQVVGTDHCPFSSEQKALGRNDFSKIPNGLAGVETRLGLLYHFGVREGRLTLSEWVRLMATNPAKLFGLYPRKGTLSVGSDADIVVFDPARTQSLDAARLHMNTDLSPYEGWELQGWPRDVLQRGRIIVREGQFQGVPGAGEFIPREIPDYQDELC
jgi:dihydropyrimidinase